MLQRVEKNDGKTLSEKIELDLGTPVLPGMVFDPKDESIIYVLTFKQVVCFHDGILLV